MIEQLAKQMAQAQKDVIVLPLSLIHAKAKDRPDGYVDDVLSAGRIADDALVIAVDAYMRLALKYGAAAEKNRQRPNGPAAENKQPHHSGPGTELKALLKKVGINPSPNCSCNARAKRMDEMEQKEPGWCESHIEEIVGWLREEATKRKLPFIDAAGRLLVRRAIANARRKSNLTQ